MFSIIIPVRNEANSLTVAIDACLRQQGEQLLEIIVVDNGSCDGSYEIASQYSEVVALKETSGSASPYSARNMGFGRSTGDVICFLDASCVPAANWLAEADKELARLQPDILAGRVDFTFQSETPSPTELWDSLTNIQQDRAVLNGCAKTTNLFVKRAVFQSVGGFREGVRSGEDVRWTRDAIESGFSLRYSAAPVVKKEARQGRRFYRKCARTGAGKGALRTRRARLIRGAAGLVMPVSPLRVYKRIAGRYPQPSISMIVRVWGVAWAARVIHSIGQTCPGLFKTAD